MRSISFLIALAAMLAPGWAHAKLRIVSTTQDPAALARAVGGDRVSVTALAKGYQDPHFLDAKPSFMLELNRADLVLSIGLDLEIGYLSALLGGARNPEILPGRPGHLDLSTAITPVDVRPGADRSQGDIHPSGNPHYWLDPANARKMARAIAERLTELDPEGTDTFAANLAAFETTLAARQAEWTARLAPLKGRPIVTFHASWTYFARAFDLNVIDYVEPKPGIPPTPRHALSVIKKMEAEDAKLVLMESFYDARIAELIASKADGKLVKVPNSVGGEEGIETYVELLDRITSALAEAAREIGATGTGASGAQGN